MILMLTCTVYISFICTNTKYNFNQVSDKRTLTLRSPIVANSTVKQYLGTNNSVARGGEGGSSPPIGL